MSAPNPYQAPQAAVTEPAGDTQPVRLFAVSGRMGRLRYVAYSVFLWFVCVFLSGILSAILMPMSTAAGTLAGLAPLLAMIVLGFMLTIQRCHDFNTSGWLSLLMLVPLVNFIFWFIPGSDGANRYGPPTPPNTTVVYIGAIGAPLLIIGFVGMLAAVAIPAYGDYAQRARVSEVISLGSAWRTAVHEHYVDTKKFPANAAELRGGAPTGDSKYGKVALGENGTLVLTMTPEAGRGLGEKTILIRPIVAGDQVNWDCTGGTLHARYRPARCRQQ